MEKSNQYWFEMRVQTRRMLHICNWKSIAMKYAFILCTHTHTVTLPHNRSDVIDQMRNYWKLFSWSKFCRRFLLKYQFCGGIHSHNHKQSSTLIINRCSSGCVHYSFIKYATATKRHIHKFAKFTREKHHKILYCFFFFFFFCVWFTLCFTRYCIVHMHTIYHIAYWIHIWSERMIELKEKWKRQAKHRMCMHLYLHHIIN